MSKKKSDVNYLKRCYKHLLTICKHKYYVFKFSVKLGIPMQGLVHDMSKFHPVEFFESVKYFNGSRSPLEVSREKNGYSKAWFRHRGRNPHHWTYWIDSFGEGGIPVKMPFNYALEMICDILAASIVYNKDNFTPDMPLLYWQREKDNRFIHRDTYSFVETVLTLYSKHGDDILHNENIAIVYYYK